MTNSIYQWNISLNFVVMVLLFVLFCCLQTACLSQFLDASWSPNLWICFTVYVALFRKLPESLIWIYLSGFLGLIFSPHCPLSFFLISQMLILFYVRFISIFWKGGVHFLMFYSTSIVLFHINNYFLSILLNFQTSSYLFPGLISVFFQVFWALLLGYPIYKLLRATDVLTKRSSVLVADTILKEGKNI